MRSLFAVALAAVFLPISVQAQIYLKGPDLAGPPLLTPELGYGIPMPGANTAEQKAALVWNMRSGLNVAALQCGFEPSLRVLENYNAMLTNHRDELQASFNSLSSYFKRTNKTVKGGQKALDTYGTRTYSSFSAVGGQLNFCSAAGRISNRALFTPRGQLATLAQERLRELYNGVKSKAGEQQFGRARFLVYPLYPNLDARCWKKNKYVMKCGMGTAF
jgi:hypothetical protein